MKIKKIIFHSNINFPKTIFVSVFVCLSLFFVSTSYSQEKRIVSKKYPNGNPSLVIILNSKGEKVKEISYFENGKMDYEGSFKNKVEHGIWTYYYEDGAKKFVETYKNGLEEGKHYEYNPDGQLEKTEIYVAGRLVETIDGIMGK